MSRKPDLDKKLNAMIKDSESLKFKKDYEKSIKKLREAIRYTNEKIKKYENRREIIAYINSEMDSVYTSQISEIIDQAEQSADSKNFSEAFNNVDNALNIANNINDSSLKFEEQNNLNLVKQKTEIKKQVEEGITSRSDNKFDDAINSLKQTLDKAKRVYEAEPDSPEIDSIINQIDQTYSAKIKSISEQGDQLKQSNELDGAIKTYESALKVAQDINKPETMEIEISKLKDLINQIYSEKLKPIIESGKSQISQNNIDESIEDLKESLKIIDLMHDSELKNSELKIIGDLLNPMFSEQIIPLKDKGNELIGKENFQESFEIINEAIANFQKALNLVKQMADSEEKQSEINNISELINKTCSAGINERKKRAIQLIDQKEFEKSISEMYSALSIAKNMACAEGDIVEIDEIKAIVNKAYIAEIEDTIKKGNDLIEEKKLDEAMDVYNEALNVTNKMYLSEETDIEINKIKNLIYQIEIKKMVSDGNVAAGEEKFIQKILELNKDLENASVISDPDIKKDKMEEIKRQIDKVHSEEIDFFIEQGFDLADKDQVQEASGLIDKSVGVITLIDSPTIKNREYVHTIDAILKIGNKTANNKKFGLTFGVYENALKVINLIGIKDIKDKQLVKLIKSLLELGDLTVKGNEFDNAFKDFEKALKVVELISDEEIKETETTTIKDLYKKELNNKAKQDSQNGEHDTAIEGLNKALELDENFEVTHYYKGNVYINKKEFEEAIKNFEKAVQLDPDYFKAWNRMGFAFELIGNLENALINYNKSIEIDSSYANGWYNRGNIYYIQNNFEQAIEAYKKATVLNPKHAKSWFFMGSAAVNLKQYKDAIESLKKAVEIDPDIGKDIKQLTVDFDNLINSLQEKLSEIFQNK